MMNHSYKTILLILTGIIAVCLGCVNNKKPAAVSSNWCDKPPRPELKSLDEVKTKRNWFKVYNVGDNVYAIIEPYNYQEVISYVVLGKEKALLFDTGMGLDSISPVVKEITTLPVTVLNSHTHYDHIGGNYEFNNILAMNTDFTRKNAANGYSHNVVQAEVTPASFCLQRLPKMDTANYSTSPFKVSAFINDGYIIDLGGRKIEVIATPGHTPDAITLFDKQNGYLWSGDSFYQGPIFLFSPETDLGAYEKSIQKLAQLAPGLQKVFPSHNIPVADPHLLIDAYNDFIEIKSGRKKGEVNADKTVLFKFDKFSFLIGQDLLK